VNSTSELKRLMEGNIRFVSGQLTHPHLEISRRLDTARNGQNPFGLVLSCLDSRVPVETIFDQGIGDLLVIRNAGPTVDSLVIGTIELALYMFNFPLVVIMGHTDCRTVNAAFTDRHFENYRMDAIINPVRNIARGIERSLPDRDAANLCMETSKGNVSMGAQTLVRDSSEVRERVISGALRLETALYHLDSGRIEWLGFQLDKAK